jgi:CRISPR-associated endonuclease/helicase Cas3
VERLKTQVPDDGRIIVATQALEAGIDITSAVMITEIAPWSSLVQRFGRVNRAGEESDAEVWWIDLPDAAAPPYDLAQLDDARQKLTKLAACGPADLASIEPSPPEIGQVIRRRDLFDLFDTDSDLAGFDIDISSYVRDANDTDARIFWREVKAGDSPESHSDDPVRDELCPVPLAGARDLIKRAKGRAWRWDALGKRWTSVGPSDLYPGVVVWVDSSVGGYDQHLGFDAAAKATVPSLSEAGEPSDAYDHERDSENQSLVSLEQHTEDVVAHARRLVEELGLTEQEHALLLDAAAFHDWGKAHVAFVAKAQPLENGPPPFTAKWPRGYQATAEQKKSVRKYFRHELASALGYLAVHDWSQDASLSAYVIAAHHGKVRMRLRALPEETAPADERPFARGVHQDDTLPAITLSRTDMPSVTLDLDIMSLGDGKYGPSWSTRSQALLAEHGPFTLAWLETLLRIADWRASEDEARLTPNDL